MSSELDRAIAAAKRNLLAGPETTTRARIIVAYRQTVERLQVDLELLQMRITEARLLGETVNPDWLRREWRYQRLITQATFEYQRFAQDAIQTIQSGQLAAVRGGAQLAQELASIMDVRFGARINTAALENLVVATDRGPVRDVLDGYGDHAANVIERELTTGLAAGTSPREITRRIVRQIGGGGTEARLATLSRTETMDAFRGSLADQFEAMKRPGDRYRRIAAKSARTCAACLALDGQITDRPPERFHPNCRCLFHLLPAGVDLPYESGADWLARQPADVQRRVIGTDAGYAAYRDGDLHLADLVGYRHDPVWGTTVRVRPVSAVIGRAA